MSNTPGNPQPEHPTSSTPLTTLAEKWARRRDEFRGIIQGGGDRDDFSAYLLTARVSRMCQVSNTRSEPPELTPAEREDVIGSHPDFMEVINTYREDTERWPADFDYGASQWGFYIWVSGREGSPAWDRFCAVARDAAHMLREAPKEYMGPLAADLDASLTGYRKWITAILWAGGTQPGGADCYADMRYLGDADAATVVEEANLFVRNAFPGIVRCVFAGPASPEPNDGWHISKIDNVVSASASLADALCRLYEQQGGAHQATGRDSSLRSEEAEKGETLKLDALSDDAKLGARDLAAAGDVEYDQLRARLDRWRNKQEKREGWECDPNPRGRAPKILYHVGAVRHIIHKMKSEK